MTAAFGSGRLLLIPHLDRVTTICVGDIRDGAWLLGRIYSCKKVGCGCKHLSAHAKLSLQVVIPIEARPLL